MDKTRAEHIKDAAQALSDLNVLGLIAESLEGSSVLNSDHANKTGERIIALCRQSIARSLIEYDRAVAAASK